MDSQNKRLHDYLKQCGSINPLLAWDALGVYRLGARVFDLRKQGVNITSSTIEIKNRFGEVCRVAKYTLES